MNRSTIRKIIPFYNFPYFRKIILNLVADIDHTSAAWSEPNMMLTNQYLA